MKKTLALLLAVLMMFSILAVPTLAAGDAGSGFTASEKISNTFYRFVDKLVILVGKILNALIPGSDWTGQIRQLKSYTPAHFYSGKDAFDTAAAENAKWSMGFADASFLTGLDVFDGSYYLTGTLEAFHGRVPTAVLDDQGVNAFALSDGETTIVYAAIDGFGFARGDVLEIRSRLEAFAAEHNIASINISALHQHSCIDTLGLGVPLVPAVLKNPAATLFNADKRLSGKNKTFMEALYSAVTASVVEAVENMTQGTLYYGAADASEFIHDKREPEVYDHNIERLRFVPDDETLNEIWICEAGIHPVSLGAGPTLLTADYPYYIEQYVKENANANMVFIQGAELAITSQTDTLSYNEETDGDNAKLVAMGNAMGRLLLDITDEEPLQPLLNVALREVAVKVENPIHILAGREGLLSSVFVRDGLGYKVITELGYIELGGTLGVVLAPGEIDPAILWGGATEKAQSWTGESWDYAPWKEICGADTLLCFGLCNDQVGYILCDNDYRSMFTENEEINAISNNVGSVLTEAFIELVNDVK